jgi:DNA-binding transcriptional regulator YdaS (Cro superfamily)
MHNAIDIAARNFNSLTEFAAEIGVSVQVVVNWRTRGVPIDHCAAVEKASKGAVRRWDLRPNDWQRIWPELVKVKARRDAMQAA